MRDINGSTRLERSAVGTRLDKKGKIARTRVDNDCQSFPLQRRSGKIVVILLVEILLISMVFLLGCARDQESATFDPSGTSAASDSNLTRTIAVDESSELTVTPTIEEEPVPALGLCEDDWEGDYCINSIGRSIDQQVISLKHSESAETEIYLVVNEYRYYCLVMDKYPGNLYCLGPLLSSPLDAEVEIVTVAEELVLARGIVDFSILDPVPTKPSDDPGYY